MKNDDALDQLFAEYRRACPDPEASQNFTPGVWAKIDGRRGLLFAFGRLARMSTAAAAGFCLLLLLLNFSMSPATHVVAPTYADALAADSQARALYGDVARVVVPAAGESH